MFVSKFEAKDMASGAAVDGSAKPSGQCRDAK
jgi:hypothetical protein